MTVIEDKLLVISTLSLPNNLYDVVEYDAMLLNSKVYYENSCMSQKRTSDSFLFNLESKKFAEIDAIIVTNENVHILINEKFEVLYDGNYTCKSSIYLKEIESPCKKILDPKSIGAKFALIKFDDIITCSEFPNMCERN